jgi:hypothetical protein
MLKAIHEQAVEKNYKFDKWAEQTFYIFQFAGFIKEGHFHAKSAKIFAKFAQGNT